MSRRAGRITAAEDYWRLSNFSRTSAIPSMAVYVCWLGQRFTAEGLTENMPALVAAGYRTSDKAIVDAGGVPPRVQPHVDQVLRHLREYTR